MPRVHRTAAASPVPPPPARSRLRPSRLIISAGAIAAVALLAWFYLGRAGVRSGPVILISIDTLRADRLPVYGYAKGNTPRLDAFARDAVTYERAYAHAPQTLPSHVSMFTGQLPFEHKVRDNLGFALPDGAITLASLFRQGGYRTAGFVSAYVLRPETGMNRGFDTYDAVFGKAGIDRSPGQVQRPGSDTLAAANNWLRTQLDGRFLLFFHIYEPHMPYAPPPAHRREDPYDGEVSYSDEIVGGLLDAIRSRGWYDAATILVLSDHGEGLGDHGELEHGLFIYDEVIRVPWLLKLPAAKGAGRRTTEIVQHIDVLPTLLEAGGLPVPAGLRGRSLLPGLAGSPPSARGVYAEALYPRYHFGWSELHSITDERYRFIKAPREELYDLARDPDERQNVAAERPQVASALRSALDGLIQGRGIEAPSAVTEQDRQRLAALGYVGTQTTLKAAAAGASLPDPKDMVPVLRKYRQAVDLIGTQQLEQGASLLREILAHNPEMSDVWSQYGAVLARMGNHAEAFRAYQQVIKRRVDPDEASGPLGAAAALLALGRMDEARAHAELAISGSPAAAHQMLANIAVSERKYDAALREAELAQNSDPALPLPAFVRGMIAHARREFPLALQHLQEARRGYENRPLQPSDLHFLIGDSLAQMERYREAEPYFREEIRLYPGSLRARAALVVLYQSTGRHTEAQEALIDIPRQIPSPAAYAAAAQMWRMFGNASRAAQVEAEARTRFSGRGGIGAAR